MGSLPLDPSTSSATTVTYKYYSPSDDQYILLTNLENESDLDIADSQTRCSIAYTSYTGTKNAATDYVVCAQ